MQADGFAIFFVYTEKNVVFMPNLLLAELPPAIFVNETSLAGLAPAIFMPEFPLACPLRPVL